MTEAQHVRLIADKHFGVGYGTDNRLAFAAFDDIRFELRIAHVQPVYFKVAFSATWAFAFSPVFYSHFQTPCPDYRHGGKRALRTEKALFTAKASKTAKRFRRAVAGIRRRTMEQTRVKPDSQRVKNGALARTQISIRLTGDVMARVDEFAAADLRSRSNAIEHLLRQALGAKEEDV
jgi:hypothetical protein